MGEKLDFMLDIIQKIGLFQRAHFRTEIVFDEKKWAMDLVSFVDTESENMFQQALVKKYPEDAIMGEESYDETHDYKQHKKLWIIDPLDGTLMYQRGIPTYWPMIAYVENGIIQCSAIYLPELNELYHADKSWSYKNNKKIHVSQVKKLESALIHGSINMLRRNFKNDQKFCHFIDTIGKHMDSYSCAFSLSNCASWGIDWDMFYPSTGRSWDTVPGWFLIQQAGGKVTNFWSNTWDIFNPFVIYSNGHIHAELQKILEY